MLTQRTRATWYRGDGMAETTAIVVSIVGTGIGIIGVMGLMLRILTTNISKQFDASRAQMTELKADMIARIEQTNSSIGDTNRRFESLTSEMHQRFDRVHQELAENRERMAKLEGSLEGFLAGRRDRDAA